MPALRWGIPPQKPKEYASTSGLVSDLTVPADEDEVYLSWIGSGLGITVAGGYTLIFDDPIITWETYLGWKAYRKFLNEPALSERIRGNQINTWNGQWLTYKLNPKDFQDDYGFIDLEQQGVFKADASNIEVTTIKWTRLFFSLSQSYAENQKIGYVYGFGQTNKTVGFIPFEFKSGRNLKQIYDQLFDSPDFEIKDFEMLFGMHIKRACELGNIGLLALRPDSLIKYMKDGKRLAFKKEEDLISYHAYKTWLIAMLSRNKEEIQDHTLSLAETIQRYRVAGTKLDRKTLIEKELFAAKKKGAFIEALIKMVKDLEGDDLEVIKNLKDEVHLMTNEEYGYFCTLLKFDYAYVEKKA